jgi:hypothetical protein
MLLLLFAQSAAKAPTATTGGSARRKKRVVQLAPVYAPTPAPEHWAAIAKRKRRNAALILALH